MRFLEAVTFTVSHSNNSCLSFVTKSPNSQITPFTVIPDRSKSTCFAWIINAWHSFLKNSQFMATKSLQVVNWEEVSSVMAKSHHFLSLIGCFLLVDWLDLSVHRVQWTQLDRQWLMTNSNQKTFQPIRAQTEAFL